MSTNNLQQIVEIQIVAHLNVKKQSDHHFFHIYSYSAFLIQFHNQLNITDVQSNTKI